MCNKKLGLEAKTDQNQESRKQSFKSRLSVGFRFIESRSVSVSRWALLRGGIPPVCGKYAARQKEKQELNSSETSYDMIEW
jgi:hypothetical protein